MLQKSYQNRKITIELILLAIYSAFVFMFDADESNVRLIYVAYGLLCFSLIFASQTFAFYRESKFFIFYLVFGVFSLLWAADLDTAFARVRAVFLLTVLLVLLTSYIVKIEKPIYLVIALVIGTVALSAYMFYLYGVSGILEALWEGGERLGSLINNVNAIGNGLVVGMIALIGLSVFYKKWILLLLLIPLGICLLAAGSRTATISFLVGFFVLFSFKIKTENNSLKKFIVFISVILIIIVVWLIVRTIPALQELVLRIENVFAVFSGGEVVGKESSAQTRMDYIELGWEQFLKSPIWGNGIGCAGYAIQEKYGHVTYLHNNYIEILASGGIIGFVLFYTPYIIILVTLIKKIFKDNEKKPILLIALALLITKLIGHMGTVMYYSKIEFLFLALLISVVNIKVSKGPKNSLLGKTDAT